MKQALIVIDYQVDFVSGALGFPNADQLDAVISAKCQNAMANQIDLYFTLDTHDEAYLDSHEGHHLPVVHCVKGSAGYEVYGKTKAFLAHAKKVFTKPTFPSLALANHFQQEAYDVVELCGLVSNICVLSNVIMVKSACPNAQIIVDSTATASFDPQLHEQALSIMRGLHVDIR